MSKKSRNDRLYVRLTERIDSWIIPVAFGTLCVLIGAQLLTSLGPVRSYVDGVEGRFIQEPVSIIPSSVHTQAATLNLYLSPTQARPDIAVILNGKTLARFTTTELTVVVHEGDELTLQTLRPGAASVTIDDDNSNLLIPAPGQVFTLSEDASVVSLPRVTFTH